MVGDWVREPSFGTAVVLTTETNMLRHIRDPFSKVPGRHAARSESRTITPAMIRPISSPSTQSGSRLRPPPKDLTGEAPAEARAFVRTTAAAVAAQIRKYAATISALRAAATPLKRAEIDQALREAFDNLD